MNQKADRHRVQKITFSYIVVIWDIQTVDFCLWKAPELALSEIINEPTISYRHQHRAKDKHFYPAMVLLTYSLLTGSLPFAGLKKDIIKYFLYTFQAWVPLNPTALSC